jgi:hypothetical protein
LSLLLTELARLSDLCNGDDGNQRNGEGSDLAERRPLRRCPPS